MNFAKKEERRKHSRLRTRIPIRFNLNPDYHHVPEMRKMGVGGTLRNVSYEGALIDSRLDLIDVCQIFPEDIEDDSPFELELALTDSREKTWLIRGKVRWYRVSELAQNTRHFQAGIVIKDQQSRAIAKGIIKSVMAIK
jgi:hypothetical protein